MNLGGNVKNKKDTFGTLKVGGRVHDIWYGNGKVIKLTQRSAYIKLTKVNFEYNVTWRYDRAHVNQFIVRGWIK